MYECRGVEVYAESLAPSDSASTVTCVEHLLGSLRVVLANAWTVARRGGRSQWWKSADSHNGNSQHSAPAAETVVEECSVLSVCGGASEILSLGHRPYTDTVLQTRKSVNRSLTHVRRTFDRAVCDLKVPCSRRFKVRQFGKSQHSRFDQPRKVCV